MTRSSESNQNSAARIVECVEAPIYARVPQLPWIHAMRQQAINFVAAIKGERKPLCEAAEALEDLKIARAYIRLLTGK